MSPKPRSIGQIITAVETTLDLPAGSILDFKRRTHDVSLARHVAMYLARKETKLSFAQIGQVFGTDHKGILYGFNRVSCAVAGGTERDVCSALRRVTG